VRAKSLAELPEVYRCALCGQEKPIAEMLLVHTEGIYRLRPRCKACHNARERGHRREYKTAYLRRWRKWNGELNESYWRERTQRMRSRINAQSYDHFIRNHAAILIQGRLRRRLGMKVSIAECRRLAKKFGNCYPTRFGLTPGGVKECERIRSRMRVAGRKVSPVEIRMMVYEDGHYIKPSRQLVPYQWRADTLRRWHQRRRESFAAKAA
jgi:hypothetical protein